MIINIHENVLTVKDIDENILKTVESVSYILYPENGRKIRNKKTGYITDSFIGVSNKSDIDDYEDC